MKSPKNKDFTKHGEDKPRIVLIGQVEELTGHDERGTQDDGATYAYRFRDLSRGACD